MNKLMGVDLRKLSLIDANKLVQSIGALGCFIQIGIHSYASAGGEYEITRIYISSNAEDLQRIALTLLACAIGTQCETYLPIGTGGLAKGIKITTWRPSEDHSFYQPRSFTYTPRRKIKRYPWYPWSLTCNTDTELPEFTIDIAPWESRNYQWDSRQNFRKLHIIDIQGFPKALVRLARLFLDYANTDIPPEQINLEVDGGFRGVGRFSYEVQLERIDI